MNIIIPNEPNPCHFGTIIGIGPHGCQALTHLHQHSWWTFICQRFDFTSLPFKYVVFDKQPIIIPHSALPDEWLPIEYQWGDNQSTLFSFDASTREKLNQWRGEFTFIISGLEDDMEAALFTEISRRYSGFVASVIPEPQSESDHAAFQARIDRIKPTAGCLIVNSTNQIRQQTVNALLYYQYQYQAISNILCGLISTLQSRDFGAFDFADLRTILSHGREAKAFYLVTTGEDRAQQLVKNSLVLLRQEGWDLADPKLTVCLWSCITNNSLSIPEFDSIPVPFMKILKDDVDMHLMYRLNTTMESDEFGLFLWVVKGEKIRYGFTSVSNDVEYLEVPEFLKQPLTI